MLKCTQAGCGRTDSDIGQCGGNHLSCPSQIVPGQGVTEVRPAGLDVIIECVPCGFTRAFPTAALTQTQRSHAGRICLGLTDDCQARARTLPGEEVKSDFVPASDDGGKPITKEQVLPKVTPRTTPAKKPS